MIFGMIINSMNFQKLFSNLFGEAMWKKNTETFNFGLGKCSRNREGQTTDPTKGTIQITIILTVLILQSESPLISQKQGLRKW